MHVCYKYIHLSLETKNLIKYLTEVQELDIFSELLINHTPIYH